MQADEPGFRLGPFQRRRWTTLCPEGLALRSAGSSCRSRLLSEAKRRWLGLPVSGPDTFRPLHFTRVKLPRLLRLLASRDGIRVADEPRPPCYGSTAWKVHETLYDASHSPCAHKKHLSGQGDPSALDPLGRYPCQPPPPLLSPSPVPLRPRNSGRPRYGMLKLRVLCTGGTWTGTRLRT